MFGVQAFQVLRPCVDDRGHRFKGDAFRNVVCERCGMTRKEAQS